LENWQVIRERVVGDEEPIMQVSRETGFAVNTVRKYTRSASPPRRTGAPTRTPVMAAFESEVDALLKAEPRITALRIAQVLREKHESFALGASRGTSKSHARGQFKTARLGLSD
jgi:transposase